jgi:hypothetical protein
MSEYTPTFAEDDEEGWISVANMAPNTIRERNIFTYIVARDGSRKDDGSLRLPYGSFLRSSENACIPTDRQITAEDAAEISKQAAGIAAFHAKARARKIIQIAAAAGGDGSEYLYALALDGTVFELLSGSTPQWRLLPPLPRD